MARTAMDLRLDRHVTRVRYGKVAPIIVAYPDNSDGYLVGRCNVLFSAKFLIADLRDERWRIRVIKFVLFNFD